MKRQAFLIHAMMLSGILLSCEGQFSYPAKTARQSKTWQLSGADRAIDNNPTTCSLAADQPNSSDLGWWQVDLGDIFTVYGVVVTTGTSDGSSLMYAQNFTISVGITNTTDVVESNICYYFNNGSYLSAAIPTTFTCTPNPLLGRYVTIKRRGGFRQDAIGLCEVNVLYNYTGVSSSSTSTVSSSSGSAASTSSMLPISSFSLRNFSLDHHTLNPPNLTASDSGDNSTLKSSDQMDQKTRTTIICVVVIIGGLLVLGGLAVLVYFLLRKLRGEKYVTSATKMTKSKKIEVVSARRPSVKPYPVSPDIEILRKPIRENDLTAYVESKKSDFGSFKEDFKKLPEDETGEANAGRKSENKSKNRFANVLPFDHTIVPLEIEEFDDPEGDYINANFIMGYRDVEKMYIATQGPKPNTLDDFWRMIWQHNVNIIAMMTSLTERGKKKCERYWPENLNSVQNFHKIAVTLTVEETYAHYAYREMVIHDERKEGMPPRTVRQLHFLTWSDKTRPDHFLSLLSFRRKVRTLQKDTTGPVVVHCSAGIGRTGAYLALDYLLEQLKDEHECSIFECVEDLRYQRMGMVQTVEQYIFLHESLADGIQAGDTGIPCSEFIKQFVEMAKLWPDGSLSTLEQQFSLLKKLKEFKTEKYSSGIEKTNISKNRDKDIVAYDDGRPRLETTYYNGTDYINAVYADSYRMKDAFILTQCPLPETIVDFWRLLWDHRLKTIVLLNDLDPSDENCPAYWSEEIGKEVHDPFEVKVVRTEEISPTILLREFSLTNTKERRTDSLTVRQFQINGWPNGISTPVDPSLLLELINILMTNANKEQLVIQCIDGASKSGLFAAAMYLVDMMKVEQVVDVFLACRFIAINRPQVVDSMAQYTFLHDFACSCLMQYEEYETCKPAFDTDLNSSKKAFDNLTVYANVPDSKSATIRGLTKTKPIRLGEF